MGRLQFLHTFKPTTSHELVPSGRQIEDGPCSSLHNKDDVTLSLDVDPSGKDSNGLFLKAVPKSFCIYPVL